MFWSTLGRMILVPLAFLIAAGTSSFILLTLGMERVTQAVHVRGSDDAEKFVAVFDLFRQGVMLATGLTVLPALAIVVLGEVARIRSSLYYIVGGGAALAAVPLLARIGQSPDLTLPVGAVWQVFATAGFVGGFVYWLMAGRRA